MNQEKILILLTNYFNENETVSFIEDELMAQSFKNCFVVIVNNGSKNKKLLNKFSTRGNIFLFHPNNNLGYLGGANLGLKKYLDFQKEIPDFVILCNSDIHFEDKDFFKKMVLKYKDTRVAMIGPEIISTFTGYSQNPMLNKRITKSQLKFYRFIFSNYFFYVFYEFLSLVKRKIFALLSIKQNIKTQAKNVYAIHGSFMIFTKYFFNKGGNFDYGSFLFGEEIFFAEIARKLNLQVCYDNSLKIIHKEHSTTRIFLKPVLLKYQHTSLSFLLKKFFND